MIIALTRLIFPVFFIPVKILKMVNLTAELKLLPSLLRRKRHESFTAYCRMGVWKIY